MGAQADKAFLPRRGPVWFLHGSEQKPVSSELAEGAHAKVFLEVECMGSRLGDTRNTWILTLSMP